MMPEPKAAFTEWYEEHKHVDFDMQRDLLRYCKMDVDILATACTSFQRLIKEVGFSCSSVHL